jgi:hypothetical protein
LERTAHHSLKQAIRFKMKVSKIKSPELDIVGNDYADGSDGLK